MPFCWWYIYWHWNEQNGQGCSFPNCQYEHIYYHCAHNPAANNINHKAIFYMNCPSQKLATLQRPKPLFLCPPLPNMHGSLYFKWFCLVCYLYASVYLWLYDKQQSNNKKNSQCKKRKMKMTILSWELGKHPCVVLHSMYVYVPTYCVLSPFILLTIIYYRLHPFMVLVNMKMQ